MRLIVLVAALAGTLAPANAAYDIENGGILRFKRNAGAQACPPNLKLVCVNRTRVVESPDQSENCGNYATAICANSPGSTLATDVFCTCRTEAPSRGR